MAEFKVRTRGEGDPRGKARVYFTCHPDDFDKYFDRICSDVLAGQDCAIYYTADMSEPIDEADMDSDLGQMNLILVPITFRLLTEDSRAMRVDVAYAKEKKIPILPFMMEKGIDSFYSRKECFGERQYLSPYSTDTTEISYNDKLKKYLEATLISDELARRVRAAFDAYVFLSYRKKDRRYANELMRIIHNIPGCRDIAIWYDEFLTPGESFMDNISRALSNSRLFTLLVTPSILEEGNFVMDKEYPAAREMGMDILPAEMVETDRDRLCLGFADIPTPLRPTDEEFSRILLQTIMKVAKSENDADPEHIFLIGLAYLDGIDVEVNRERGIELITTAAEAGLPEAMEKLYNVYLNTSGDDFDIEKAQKWAGRLADYYTDVQGEEHIVTLLWMHNHCYTYQVMGKYQQAAERGEYIYGLKRRLLGEEHPDTLLILNNLALVYRELGKGEKQQEMLTKVYEIALKTLGEEHPTTLLFLSNLAYGLQYMGNYPQALELHTRAYRARLRVLGEDHTATVDSLSAIALCHLRIGERARALEIQEKVCSAHLKMNSADALMRLDAQSLLGIIHYELGHLAEAEKIVSQVYLGERSALGEGHPNTLNAMNTLGLIYHDIGKLREAREILERGIGLHERFVEVKNTLYIQMENNLALVYLKLRLLDRAIELQQRVCEDQVALFGEDHPNSLKFRMNLAVMYGAAGRHKDALATTERLYGQCRESLGERHPDTLMTLYNLATCYSNLRMYKQACPLFEKVYLMRRDNPNEKRVDLMASVRLLTSLYIITLQWGKAWGMLKEMFRLSMEDEK